MDHMEITTILGTAVPSNLRRWYDALIEDLAEFWQQGPYTHYTNHGVVYSKTLIDKKLNPLVRRLTHSLTPDEAFVLAASAYLYETGLQSTDLYPVLNLSFTPDQEFSPKELGEIRSHSCLLTRNLIQNSSKDTVTNKPWPSCVIVESEYVRVIGKLCGCVLDDIDSIAEIEIVNGGKLRFKLLVLLLRFADQLYIAPERVSRDVLEQANLPVRDKVFWWLFNYVDILPPEDGKIVFHYTLPIGQDNLLEHIREVYEPLFEYKNNQAIQYLAEHGLSLRLLNKPFIDFDASLDKVPADIAGYLVSSFRLPDHKKVEERCLLILDYENFVLQLGQQGQFDLIEDIEQTLVSLLTAARNFYGQIRLDALAIGHWSRADLTNLPAQLRSNFFQPLTIELGEVSINKLRYETQVRLESSSPPTQIIFVAPSDELSTLVIDVFDRLSNTVAWITDLPEGNKYSAVVFQFKRFSDILRMSVSSYLDKESLSMVDTAAILGIASSKVVQDKDIHFDTLIDIFRRSEILSGKEYWCRLRLIKKNILRISKTSPDEVVLSEDHPQVTESRNKLQAILQAITNVSINGRGVQEDLLIDEMKRLADFSDNPSIQNFLLILKDQDLLFREALPQTEQQSLWILNPSHPLVVIQRAEHYLSLMVLALDHFLLQRGFHYAHDKQLKQVLAPYISKSVVERVYELGVKDGYLITKKADRDPRRTNVVDWNVFLNAENSFVSLALFQRDVLLDIIASNKEGIERERLWHTVRKMERMELSREILDEWLTHLDRDLVIRIERHQNSSRQDKLYARADSVLFQRLRGRLNILGLIKNLRILGATNPAKKKPSGEVVDSIARYATRGDKVLAGWTLDYAKMIKVVNVESEETDLGKKDFVFLVTQHSLLSQMQSKENENARLIVSLAKEISIKPGDWINKKSVLKAMEKAPSLGYSREEREYWLDQTIHRLRLLEQQIDRSQPNNQFLVRIKT